MSTTRHTVRPYPRRCRACGEIAVRPAQERRTVEAKYDGTVYKVAVPDFPVNRCGHCGATTVGPEADDATNRALRDHVGLLHPHEIRANRETLGLTQRELAEHLGCAPETVSRWETEAAIQALSFDRILRAFFHLPALRGFLKALGSDPSLGRSVTNQPDEDRHLQTPGTSDVNGPSEEVIFTVWPLDVPPRVLVAPQPRIRAGRRAFLSWTPRGSRMANQPGLASVLQYLRSDAWMLPDE